MAELCGRLRVVCPDDLVALPAPFTVRVSAKTEVQPDLLVGRRADFTGKLPVAPLPAVEVLSPSTGIRDLTVKKDAYERMGVVSYWVIDPQEPVGSCRPSCSAPSGSRSRSDERALRTPLS